MTSLKDIAKRTGVSLSTVSNVLNGRSNVSQATRERILQCCAELGYVPNAAGSRTKHEKSNTIVFIFSDFDRDFYLKIIEGISDCLNENGYDLMICTNKSSKKFMKRSLVSGTISLDGSLTDETLVSIAKPDFPVVLMDRILDYDRVNATSVIVDNYPVMCEMVQALIDKGFRDFGFLGGMTHTLDNKERYAAFIDTLAKNDIPFDQRNYFHGNYRENSGYQAAKLMILSNVFPEVLVCANDNMAIGVMKALEEHGIKVPDDMSVTGFDDSEAAAFAGLTTISIPRYESGYLAAKELLEMIKGGEHKGVYKLNATIKWRRTVK